MKRIAFIILVLALLPTGVSAADVSVEKALAVAGRFLGTDALSVRESSVAMRTQGRDSQPDFYVFNNPAGGWVIIAADDRVAPILAYSNTGSFQPDDMPGNVRYWMDGVAGIIDSVRAAGLTASENVRSMWSSTPSENDNSVILETAEWGQDSPFNDLCPIPVDGQERALTGCVATAMSIVMRYNSWPEHGTGTVGGYRSYGYAQYFPAYSIDGHEYDWESMPLIYDVSSSDKAAGQVATLMLDCGMAVKMGYQKEGSGAFAVDIADAMRSHFSYKSVRYVDRALYQPDEWFSIIRKEIDASRVVLYSGQTKSEGHQFVCDGYDPDASMLHMNWGWEGKCNGFFTLDLDVAQIKTKFEYNQSAVIGIAPGKVDIGLGVQPVAIPKGVGMAVADGSTLSKDGKVILVTDELDNISDTEYSFQAKACLVNSKGEVRQQIGLPIFCRFDKFDGTTLTFMDVLAVQPEISDFFQLFVTDSSGEWVPLKFDTNYSPSGQNVCCGMTQDPLILIADDCNQSDVVKLELGYGRMPVRTVTWYVNGQKYTDKTLTVQQGKTEIRADVEYCDDSTGSISKTLVVE